MADTRYVYDFDERSDGGRELLGGKGVGLAEMTQLGVRVPTGFTITTDACRAYMAMRRLPDGLEEEVAEHVRRLEERTETSSGSLESPKRLPVFSSRRRTCSATSSSSPSGRSRVRM